MKLAFASYGSLGRPRDSSTLPNIMRVTARHVAIPGSELKQIMGQKGEEDGTVAVAQKKILESQWMTL